MSQKQQSKTPPSPPSDLQEDSHDDDRYQEEQELLDEPGGPQNPLAQPHHLHGLSDAHLLLQNKFLGRLWEGGGRKGRNVREDSENHALSTGSAP